MIIKPMDFIEEYYYLKEELDAAYGRVMQSGRYILGEEVSSFEKEFAKKSGSKYCVGVGNGLDAIQLALHAIGIGRSDEVIVPSNTYIATWIGVSLTDAKPIPVDPDEKTYNIEPGLIEENITKKTKAILPVHLYGQPADMDPISEIAMKYDLKVIDDAAQAHGAKYKGRPIGSLADATAFSFYPTKNLGGYGDGGGVTTDNKEIYEKLKVLRNYGESKKYVNDVIGFNSRLDEIQAAFLRVKLKHLDQIIEKKRKIAEYYMENIINKHVTLPYILPGAYHVWHQFVIRSKRRTELKNYLKANNIETLVHYPISPLMQKAYFDLFPVDTKTPVAKLLSTEVLSLPIHFLIRDEEMKHIVRTLNKFIPSR